MGGSNSKILRCIAILAVGLGTCTVALLVAGGARFRAESRPIDPMGAGSPNAGMKSGAQGRSEGRSLSAPAQIEVPAAAVTAVLAVSVNSDAPPLADVGAFAFLSADPAAPAKSERNQIDAEMPDMRSEPQHPVAPVPVEDNSLAAVNVALASISPLPARHPRAVAILFTSAPQSRVYIAAIAHPVRQLAAQPIGDLKNQMNVAHSRRTKFVAAATFDVADIPDTAIAPGLAIPRGWPRTDETPLLVPAVLLNQLAPDDPLNVFSQMWNTGEHVSASPVASNAALAELIAKSSEPWQILYQMGRISGFLDGDSLQQPFWRAAVLREGALPPHGQVMSRDIRSMEILAGMFLWVWKNDDVAATALRNLLRTPGLSGFRAGQAALLLANVVERPKSGTLR